MNKKLLSGILGGLSILTALVPARASQINVTAKYPEGFEYQSLYLYSLHAKPHTRWSGTIKDNISINWSDDTVYLCADGIMDGIQYIYVTPDIEVRGDTDVTIDFNQCVNQVDFHPVLPNGENLIAPLREANTEATDQPNVREAYWYNYIYRREVGISVFHNWGILAKDFIDGKEAPNRWTYMINDLTDDYEIKSDFSFDLVDTGEHCTVAHFKIGDSVRGLITDSNDPSSYVKITADFGTTPPGPYDVSDAYWSIISYNLLNGNLLTDGSIGHISSLEPAEYSLVSVTLSKNGFLTPIFQIGKCVQDNGGTGPYREFYPICSPPFTLQGSKARFNTMHTDEVLSYFHIRIPES